MILIQCHFSLTANLQQTNEINAYLLVNLVLEF